MSSTTTTDFEKLTAAFGDLGHIFSSYENILDAFGLLHMPSAQRYGIAFGFVTFFVTVTTVFLLLTFGGSFERIAQQAKGEVTIPHSHTARQERALLLEHLLDARERMMKNYADVYKTLVAESGLTHLTRVLLNDHAKTTAGPAGVKEYPEGYQNNYEAAYRQCQDAPGGPAISGRPESRFEAYARAFAGCGNYTQRSYRRSYARVYEAVSCQNHDTDDKYSKLFQERPQDIIGKSVRLEALDVERHLNALYQATSGEADSESHAYDPQEVWGFQEEGPFATKEEMAKSFVFERKVNEAAFAIINNVTDRMVGCIILKNDNPRNLSVQMEVPITRPSMNESPEKMEACFLLQDRLFALGYRRIQMSVDAQDSLSRKMAIRLAFTLEGTLYKDMILKDASRDSAIYGILNSDWDRGARTALYGKLYGKGAAKTDLNRRKKEEETDEQNRVLAEQKAGESKDKKA